MARPGGSAVAAPAGPPAPRCLLVGRCQCDLRRNGHAHSEAPDAPRGSEVTMVAVRANGVHLGRIVSQLLAVALAFRKTSMRTTPFAWTARPMGARLDLSDKDAIYRILDGG